MFDRLILIMKRLLPSPFSIAIILTISIFLFCINIYRKTILEIALFWENGLWNPGLMNFAMQMMLTLVLGYVIALSSISEKIINQITFFALTHLMRLF